MFVTGPIGVGKTEFIKNRFAGNPNYFVLDPGKEAIRLYGTVAALDYTDPMIDVMNHCSTKAQEALIDGKTIVVEFAVSGYDDDLMAMLKEAKTAGLRTDWVQLTADDQVIDDRLATVRGEYYSSALLRDINLELLESIIECHRLNLDLTEVAKFGYDEGEIFIYRMSDEGQVFYTYVSSEIQGWQFEPAYEFEKERGVDYLRKFPDFRTAFEDMRGVFAGKNLVMLSVREGHIYDIPDDMF